MPTTTGMKGEGFYNAHSSEQRAAIDAFLPWLMEAIMRLPVEAAIPLTLLDLGSAEGGNAIYVMRELAAAIRARTESPIQVCFSDLPTNDYNSLFRNLFPTDAQPAFGSEVYTSVAAGSAFKRIVPDKSLHVATTFNAIGFLDHKPENAPLQNYILPMAPGAPRKGVSVSETEQAPFREQAAHDLISF